MRGRRGVLLSFLFVSGSLLGCESKVETVAKPKPTASAPGPDDKDAPTEFTSTESGLKYRILRKSDGEKPVKGKQVLVNTRGWLDDESLFDTTYGTGGVPRRAEVASNCPGWVEGVQLVGIGGKIELEIPPKLGYGSQGNSGIPVDSTLHYIIELLEISDPPKPPEHMPHPAGPGGPGGAGAKSEPGKVDADAPTDFTTTPSGLKYRIRRQTDGRKPTASNSVRVHYRGWLDNGTEFDSSYARNEPANFALTGVIKGWTEGLQLIGVGGMIEFEIPPELAYGADAKPTIPANSTLHFVVELLDMR